MSGIRQKIADKLVGQYVGDDGTIGRDEALRMADALLPLIERAATHTDEGKHTMTSETRYARYYTRVHAMNRASGTGDEIVVIASSRKEAVDRAITLGWDGYPEHARVCIYRVEDIDPRDFANSSTPPDSGHYYSRSR